MSEDQIIKAAALKVANEELKKNIVSGV